ncbi:hypothetical protein [Nostoc sp.]
MPQQHQIVDENEIASLGASLRAIEQKLLKQGYKIGITKILFQSH